MAKCPDCGKLGAVVMSREKGRMKIFCNNCQQENSVPVWVGIGLESAEYLNQQQMFKKEDTTMKVSYNGFTGELVKLEKSNTGKFEFPIGLTEATKVKWLYDLSIYDSEKQVTQSFTGVKLKDVKFINGTVTFGG